MGHAANKIAPLLESTHQDPVRKPLLPLVTFLFMTACLRGETLEPHPAPKPLAALGPRDAIVLGVVEGITEFLPISSTGHLIITNHFLHLESEQPLSDASGQPLWHKKPSVDNPAGEPLTLKLAADTFIVVIQIGAILAVIILYWSRIGMMLGGLAGRDPAGLRLVRNLVLAFLPVALVGLAASSLIERHLFSTGSVIIGLVAGAGLMFWVERRRQRGPSLQCSTREPADLSATAAFKIGLFQCFALWPGTSRSMVTIVGGYLAGLSPTKAAEFSFLLGLPVLAGAAVVKGYRSGPAMIAVFGWSDVVLGMAVSALCAGLAVKFLVTFLTKHGLQAFAVYRLLLSALLAIIFYL